MFESIKETKCIKKEMLIPSGGSKAQKGLFNCFIPDMKNEAKEQLDDSSISSDTDCLLMEHRGFSGCGESKNIYLVENTTKRLNWTYVNIVPDPETVKQMVREKLRITENFILYDKNGCEIFNDDFNLLRNKECIYVCPASKDFDYLALLEMYTKICKLGSGGFGNVYKLKHKLNNEIVACKLVRVSEHLHKADRIQQILKEAQYLMTLDHENILKLETAFLVNQEIAIITEYIPGGELGDFIEKQPAPLTEMQACAIMVELVSAIVYVHYKKILHRDLKLENILLKDEKTCSVKIIDFGLASLGSNNSVGQSGTLLYSPPELLNGESKKSSSKTDVWSLGVILYIMITKKFPFEGPTEEKIMQSICKSKLKFPKECVISSELKDLIQNMLEKNPNTRFNINQVNLHPWLEMNKDKIHRKSIFKPKNDFLSPSMLKPTADLRSGNSKNLSHLASPDDKFNRPSRPSRSRLGKDSKKNLAQNEANFLLSPLNKMPNAVTPKKDDGTLKKNLNSKIRMSNSKHRNNRMEIMLSSLNSIKHLETKQKKKKTKRANIPHKRKQNHFPETRGVKSKGLSKGPLTNHKIVKLLEAEKIPTTAYYQAWLRQHIQKHQNSMVGLKGLFVEMKKKFEGSKESSVMFSPNPGISTKATEILGTTVGYKFGVGRNPKVFYTDKKSRAGVSSKEIGEIHDTLQTEHKLSPKMVSPITTGNDYRRGSMFTNLENSNILSQNRSSDKSPAESTTNYTRYEGGANENRMEDILFKKLKFGTTNNLQLLKKNFLSSKTIEQVLLRNERKNPNPQGNYRRRILSNTSGKGSDNLDFSNKSIHNYRSPPNSKYIHNGTTREDKMFSFSGPEKKTWGNHFHSRRDYKTTKTGHRKVAKIANLKMMVKANTKYVDEEYLNDISKRINI
ncbi:unnamed protein product [Moneuplotes crassus]|uniref:Protein kinase domain-containing protein n=1 Tax=Euplotes crassus TaxID=5936 RepID=A0AAD1UCK4_EUPCR|nr:unnamed protein product [Moneuplotes crassus]